MSCCHLQGKEGKPQLATVFYELLASRCLVACRGTETPSPSHIAPHHPTQHLIRRVSPGITFPHEELISTVLKSRIVSRLKIAKYFYVRTFRDVKADIAWWPFIYFIHCIRRFCVCEIRMYDCIHFYDFIRKPSIQNF